MSDPFASAVVVNDAYRQAMKYLTIGSVGSAFLVRINTEDGTVEFGPNYTPDEAARVFWQALAAYRP